MISLLSQSHSQGTRSRYDLLEDSIVGPVLKSLFVALSRKENGHDVAFKTALLRALIPLASLFDKINAHVCEMIDWKFRAEFCD